MISVKQAADLKGLDSACFHRLRKKRFPKWMTSNDNGTRFFVDEFDPDFAKFCKKCKKKSNAQKKSVVKRGGKQGVAKSQKPILQKSAKLETANFAKNEKVQNSPPLTKAQKDLAELKIASENAELADPIYKTELQRYKIEQEKIALKIKSGELLYHEEAEFLYFGYLDKSNVEHLMYAKKIEQKIEDLISDEIINQVPIENIAPDKREEIKDLLKHISAKVVSKKISNLVAREEETIIASIKLQQLEDQDKWKKAKGL